MKKLQILGTGCAKCNALAEATKKAAGELGLACEVEKVTDIKTIMSFGVMTTPALAVDGNVEFAGKIPSHDELKSILGSAN
ncbi:MAG: thioredoxin family protein [Verrucomicrobiae bacterium]